MLHNNIIIIIVHYTLIMFIRVSNGHIRIGHGTTRVGTGMRFVPSGQSIHKSNVDKIVHDIKKVTINAPVVSHRSKAAKKYIKF